MPPVRIRITRQYGHLIARYQWHADTGAHEATGPAYTEARARRAAERVARRLTTALVADYTIQEPR